jgi:hypothetical protein
MPSSKKFDWRYSDAKKIVMADLEEGRLSLDENEVSAEAAFAVYKTLPEFEKVCFEQFEARLKAHRELVAKKIQQSIVEESAFQHNLLIHPRNETHDRRGKLIFDRHPAKLLLRQDIKDGAYPRLSPMELWHSREEYQCFELGVFRQRVYQEI